MKIIQQVACALFYSSWQLPGFPRQPLPLTCAGTVKDPMGLSSRMQPSRSATKPEILNVQPRAMGAGITHCSRCHPAITR